MRKRTPFQRINIDDAEKLIGSKTVLLLDVREANDFNGGHIAGAQHTKLSGLSPLITGTDKARPVVIYCYRGRASQEYAQAFSDFGFTEVYSVDGGYEEWSRRKAAAPSIDHVLQAWLAAQGFPENQIDSTIHNQTTPLMNASHLGEEDIVRRLIAAGAALNARNADGNTALWLACVGNHLKIIDVLVGAGIDIDNRNDNDATALMYAASTGKADVVAHLLARGANTGLETLDGFTALDMAATVECLGHLRRAEKAKRNDMEIGVAR